MPAPAAVTISEPPPTVTPEPSWVPSQSPIDPPSRSQSYDAKVSLTIVLLCPLPWLISKFSSLKQPDLEAENARLESELFEAKEKIRNLELQVEAIRANARKAAQALLNE